MKKFRHLLAIVALLASLLASSQPSCAAARARDRTVWLYKLLGHLASRGRCILAIEDVVPKGKGKYSGISNMRVPVPPRLRTVGAVVKFLSANLPGWSIWRDKGSRRAVHIVYSKALQWKSNPMNHKFTFHGTMTFMQLVSRVFARRFPKLQFYYNPFATSFLLPYAPDLTAYKTPLHFNVKDMTLRKFLTTGMVYQMNPQHFGGTFWQVTYMVRHGKFTGRVEITMQGWPVSASAAAGGPAKQSTAKTK